jgi:uncharacterized membrane protein YhaH (DUF805 family)
LTLQGIWPLKGCEMGVAMMALVRFYLDPRGRISRKDFWLKLVLVGAIVETVFASSEATWQSFRAGPSHFILSFGLGFEFPFWADLQNVTSTTPFLSAFALLWFWPPVAVSIKRMHDLGWSIRWLAVYVALGVAVQVLANFGTAFGLLQSADGSPGMLWYVLVGLSAVGLLGALSIGVLPGQKGSNRFGPDPLDGVVDGKPESEASSPV